MSDSNRVTAHNIGSEDAVVYIDGRRVVLPPGKLTMTTGEPLRITVGSVNVDDEEQRKAEGRS